MAQAGQQEQQHESVVEWALPLIDAEGVGGGGVPAGGTCAPAAGAGGADGGSTPDLVKAGWHGRPGWCQRAEERGRRGDAIGGAAAYWPDGLPETLKDLKGRQ